MAPDSGYAFVTLVTSDAYLPGALVVVHAIRDIHPRPAQPPEVDFQTVCLVTPETVDVSTIRALRKAFDLVIGVEIIEQQAEGGKENLGLLGRRDLTTVLTKLHVFRLTQFSKVIFLDADTLPLQPMSHLFLLPHKLAAAPDSGWPDCFNSGVLVLEPSLASFDELMSLTTEKGSWDGGDQGVLNEWAGDDWHRISFRYNTTPTAAYTYKPAYVRYHSDINLLHFIGSQKPWVSLPTRPSRPPPPPLASSHDTTYAALIDQWYGVYDRHYRPLAGDASGLPYASPSTTWEPTQAYEQRPFQPPRYNSAWSQPKSSDKSEPERELYGLDRLRDLALKGVGSSYPIAEGEGRYESLPMEGRVDLMRPRTETTVDDKVLPAGAVPMEERDDEDDDLTPKARPAQVREHSGYYPPHLQRDPEPPHPEPEQLHEGSPAHHAELVGESLPRVPEDQHHDPPQQHHQSAPPAQQHHQPAPPAQQHYQPPPGPGPAPQHHHPGQISMPPVAPAPAPAPKPFSPPMFTWNPAHSPPPNDPPPSSQSFPEWSGNVWDQSQNHPRGFFQAPPQPAVPERLVEQGHYSNVMHNDPDLSKVKEVFPWEGRQRVSSGRAWPKEPSPPPLLPEIKPISPDEPDIAGPQLTLQGPTPEISPQMGHQQQQVKSPPGGLPTDMMFRNAWDADPHIQRYVSKLVRPGLGSRVSSFTATRERSPLATPGLKGNFSFKRPRERGEGGDASSRDGDDEDNDSESEEEFFADEYPGVGRRAREDSDDEGGRGARGERTPPRGSRSGPVSTGGGDGGGTSTKKYRNQAAQTDPPPPHKHRSVQVNLRTDFFAPIRGRKTVSAQTQTTTLPPSAAPPRPQLPPAPMPVPDTQYLLPQQQMPATPSPHDPPPGSTGLGISAYQPGLEDQMESPRMNEPELFESYFPPLPKVESPVELTPKPSTSKEPLQFPAPVPSSTTQRPAPVPLPEHVRLSSNETQLTTGSSPPSSIIMSPQSPEGTPRAPAMRRWDPARDVDLFKRDSQEVLARFLRMNEWEGNV